MERGARWLSKRRPTNRFRPMRRWSASSIAGRRARLSHRRRRRPARRSDEELARQTAQLRLTASSASPAWAMKLRPAGARPWPTRPATPIVMVGDGTYMMMNSDIYSTVLTGHKIIVIVCDNGGYAVINRLQNGKGGASLQQSDQGLPRQEAVRRGLCQARRIDGCAGAQRSKASPIWAAAVDWAKTTDRTTVSASSRRLHLDTRRCLVGCRRAAGQRPQAGPRSLKRPARGPQETACRRLTHRRALQTCE